MKINGIEYELQLWDTGGLERYRALNKIFFRDADRIIVMYDITNKRTFDEAEYHLNEAKENNSENAGIILLGNKLDLQNTSRAVSYEEGKIMARNHNVLFLEISTLTGENVDAAIEMAIKYEQVDINNRKNDFILNNIFNFSNSSSSNYLDLNNLKKISKIGKYKKEEVSNVDFMKELECELFCKLCQNIMYDPYECQECGSLCCSECYAKYQKENNQNCPFTENIIENNAENTPGEQQKKHKLNAKKSILAQKLLNKLIFKCRLNCGNENIPYEKLESHLKNDCPKLADMIKPFKFDEIEKEDIINKDYLECIKDEIMCSICQNIVYDAVMCNSCQNSFCRKCINEWNKKSKTCPFKCNGFQVKENRIVRNLLSKLKFRCINYCNNEIEYDELEKHYLEKCPNIGKSKTESKNEYDKIQKK